MMHGQKNIKSHRDLSVLRKVQFRTMVQKASCSGCTWSSFSKVKAAGS